MKRKMNKVFVVDRKRRVLKTGEEKANINEWDYMTLSRLLNLPPMVFMYLPYLLSFDSNV